MGRRVEQYSVKLRVWGGVSAQGNTRLIFYDGNLGAHKYRDKILKVAKPDFEKVFGHANMIFLMLISWLLLNQVLQTWKMQKLMHYWRSYGANSVAVAMVRHQINTRVPIIH